MGELVVGLDIGTHKICTVVGEVRPDDIFVVGAGIERSRGVKKGVVNDIGALTTAISASVHKAEQTSGYEIERAFVSVAGSHVASLTSHGMAGIPAQRSVRPEDLDKALENARTIAIAHNREVLHVVPRRYSLDGHEVRSPIGMHGYRLEVDAHIITAASSSIANLEQAVEAAGVYVDRFILNPLAAGDAVLTDEEREMGVVVIDIGGGTTDLAIFIENTVWHTSVISVGGDHVTNDITYVMRIPFETAEAVKIQYGHALAKEVNPSESFLVEQFGEGMPVKVQRSDIAQIIEARFEEIFEMAQKEIKRSGYDGLLRAGAVITGGSSQLPGVRDVASRVFGFPIRLAKPERLTGMADTLRNPAYSTSVGLLGLGLEMDTAPEMEARVINSIPGARIGSFLGSFFRRLLPDAGE